MKNTSLENFLDKVDDHMTKQTRKSRNGRVKSNFEMKVFWFKPKGGKFTYRGDDTIKKLKENNNISVDNELKALQVQFGIIRKRALAIVIYDNTKPYNEDNILFHYEKGNILVNDLEWNSPSNNK